jgi:transcriptional regulator with XRE-family HTH domain
MEPNHERLLRLVDEARTRLGLAKQAKFIEATGLGKTTVRRFEQGETLSEPTLRTISLAVGWTRDSARAVLEGGEPTLATPAPTPDGTPDQQPAPLAALAARLPASTIHELENGELFATDTYDLTTDGGLRLFTVVIRTPDQEPRSPEQVKAETEAWYRTQRELRQRPPVDTGRNAHESGSE